MSRKHYPKLGQDVDPELSDRPTRDSGIPLRGVEEESILADRFVADDPARTGAVRDRLHNSLSDVQEMENDTDRERLNALVRDFNRSKPILFEAYFNVMMGGLSSADYLRNAYGADRLQKGAGTRNPAISRVLDEIIGFDQMMQGSQKIFRPHLPQFYSGDEMMASPSYTADGIKYLLGQTDSDEIGFRVEVPFDEYVDLVLETETGKLQMPSHQTQLHVTPFFHVPISRISQEADENHRLYLDTHERGPYLPTFVQMYTEWVAFAIQDHPVALAAALLARDKPAESKLLLDEQKKILAVVSSHVLTQLGYVPRNGRNLFEILLGDCADPPPFVRPSFVSFQTLKNWRDHFCTRLFLVEFAASFLNVEVVKTPDMAAHMFGRHRASVESTLKRS